MPNKSLEELKEIETYTLYQEELGFKKELNILRNDFYYQLIESKKLSLVDFLYKPLDVMSGDAYTARIIDENRTFYLIVDGMGKGLSASLTAMVMTTFVNHIVDKMIEHDSFSLDLLIQESMEFIKPVLLEEEALSLDYILFDSYFHTLEYAKFSMPAFLLQDKDQNIVKVPSNNPPLSKYSQNYQTKSMDVSEIEKFLFYSDGIVENSLNGEGTYADCIEEDFTNSFTREELKEKMFERLSAQEDDFTLIFINTLPLNESTLCNSKSFNSSLHDTEKANEWYEGALDSLSDDVVVKSKAGVVFTELFMNAYEHGNLGLETDKKHTLLEEDRYFETLEELEKGCKKKIEVSIHKLNAVNSKYIVTQIKDEGEGFDTKILSEIFRNSAMFNGRGVFVSRKNSMGIYYNAKGNSVLFLHKI